MDETYRLKALVIGREAFREHDLLVDLLTEERGRLKLVARGAKKFRSKVAAHVEPFCVIEAMAIRGRQHDYLGSALSAENFSIIKSDLERLRLASDAVILVRELLREKAPEASVFKALLEYLTYLNQPLFKPAPAKAELFTFKVYAALGIAPDLFNCPICGRRLTAGDNFFRPAMNQLVDGACKAESDLTISDDTIKILRLVNSSFFQILAKKIANRGKIADELNIIANSLKAGKGGV